MPKQKTKPTEEYRLVIVRKDKSKLVHGWFPSREAGINWVEKRSSELGLSNSLSWYVAYCPQDVRQYTEV